jgi:hypothetical protein
MKRACSLAAVAALSAALAGCGPRTATVSGEVTYAGQPVGDGHITFTPADGRGKDAGGPIRGGRYRVSGLAPGPKVVKVIAVRPVNFASSSEEMMRRSAEARKAGNHDGLVDPADTIPEDAPGNNAEVRLKPGDNVYNFHLQAPAGK